jgi:hypothetical protein
MACYGDSFTFFFYLSLGLEWNYVSITSETYWSVASCLDDNGDDCGATGWMTGRGNQSTRRKPAPVRHSHRFHRTIPGLKPRPSRREAADLSSELGHGRKSHYICTMRQYSSTSKTTVLSRNLDLTLSLDKAVNVLQYSRHSRCY